MTILNCKICGGDIELSADKTYGTCDSCGSNTTFPKVDDEQKAGLFNRGNALRIRGEYDKAATVFERIIEEDNTDAEAHWCLALCRYGIEYVEDPKSGEHIPTCHRASYDSFFNDLDYLAAVEYSDSHTASIYTQEAKRISEIQKAILKISQQEEPFDVFICYKETTFGGSRSKDSIIAQEIYYELTEAGYKVFFARITLEEKIGTEYEPYIFAALNSAKVMVVVGTSAEHFTAVWVKNEWSRFLSIMKNDRNRLLIPCYRDIDPYDLPDELAMLQSQDMSKIGFMQDLTRGITKVLEAKTTKTTTHATANGTIAVSLERLIENSNTYLKLTNYHAAQEVFNRITKEYPEDYRGWWGLILSETKGFSVVAKDIPTLNKWFKYVKQLADAEAFTSLEAEYIEYTKIIADADTQNEISKINNSIDKINARLKKLNGRKGKLERSKQQSEKNFNRDNADFDNKIQLAENDLAACEKDISTHTNKKIIGLLLLTLPLLLLFSEDISFSAGFFSFSAMFIGLLMVILGHKGKTGRELEQARDNGQSIVQNINKAKAAAINNHNNRIKELNKQIEAIINEIAKVQKRVTEHETYLAQGESKMRDMFFADRCIDFGIKQEFDKETENLREIIIQQETNDPIDDVFDDAIDDLNHTSTESTQMETECPFCKEKLTFDESDITEGCKVMCYKCGNTLECQIDESEPQYEISCPTCYHTFVVEQDLVDSGSVHCPSCGELLEIGNPESKSEVACPFCHDTMIVNQDEMNSGSAYCRSCGAQMKFSESKFQTEQSTILSNTFNKTFNEAFSNSFGSTFNNNKKM